MGPTYGSTFHQVPYPIGDTDTAMHESCASAMEPPVEGSGQSRVAVGLLEQGQARLPGEANLRQVGTGNRSWIDDIGKCLEQMEDPERLQCHHRPEALLT